MQQREQLLCDGLTREYLIYQPDSLNNGKRYPLIISLHGTLGSAEQMMGFADFRALAEKEKFLIVCPEGITKTWNDGRETKANQRGIDDVHFINELISHLCVQYPVDPKRIFVTGISNGGFMASRLACESPGRLAAVAVVAASLDRRSGIRPGSPLPVMYMHGTRDRLVPYEGGATKATGGDVYGHEEIVKLWMETNKCGPRPFITMIADGAGDQTTVTRKEYFDLAGLKVVDYTIVNGGHTWPGGPQYASPFFVGLVSHNVDACKAIWDFFKIF